jgi:hypothetical protein
MTNAGWSAKKSRRWPIVAAAHAAAESINGEILCFESMHFLLMIYGL